MGDTFRMLKEISLFPILGKEIKNNMEINISMYKIYYNFGNEKIPLVYDTSSNIISFQENTWNLDENNLVFESNIEILNSDILFGDNGIACKSAVIGIGLSWYSKSSNQRGVLELGSLKIGTYTNIFDLKKEFYVGQLRGELVLQIIIYIKKSGIPDTTEMHLANEEGYVLGNISEETYIYIDGEGSVFPIYEIEDSRKLLWDIELKWDDPEKDLFIDSVSIIINKSHKDYIFLDRNSKKYNGNMLNEIIASSILLIILKLKEDGDLPTDDSKFEEGSILQAVTYFKENMDLDFTNSEIISKTIRNYFNKIGGVNNFNN